jgi:hypothetical protein
MKRTVVLCLLLALVFLGAYPLLRQTQLGNCVAYAIGSFREVAQDRSARFLGKVHEDSARCRGGEPAVACAVHHGLTGNVTGPLASGVESLISGLSATSALSA